MTASAVVAPATSRAKARRQAMTAAPLGDIPWTRRAALVLALGMAVGAIGLAVAWFGASGTATFRTELMWIAIGVLMCAVAAIGEVAWLVVGFRRLRRERRVVANLIARRHQLRAAKRADTAAQLVDQPVDPAAYVATPAMQRRHRPSCDVVHGKEVEVLSEAQSEERGLVGCGMCGS